MYLHLVLLLLLEVLTLTAQNSPPEISYAYGLPVIYQDGDRSTTLSFKYYPTNGFKFHTKCYFASLNTQEKQVVFDQSGSSQFFGSLSGGRATVDDGSLGRFDLIISKPSSADEGQYRCAFNTNRSIERSAVAFLSQIQLTVSDVYANRARISPDSQKVVLSWRYEPTNAAISKVECLYLSTYIKRMYTLNPVTGDVEVGDRYLRRLSHSIGGGFFNLTLNNPTRADAGYYECEFHSQGAAKVRKAMLSLVSTPIQYVYGFPAIYKANSPVDLSWKLVPSTGHLVNTKCFFTPRSSVKEQSILTYPQPLFYNTFNINKASVSFSGGYFTISIRKLTEKDKGRYRCVFTTEEEDNLSYTLFLSSLNELGYVQETMSPKEKRNKQDTELYGVVAGLVAIIIIIIIVIIIVVLLKKNRCIKLELTKRSKEREDRELVEAKQPINPQSTGIEDKDCVDSPGRSPVQTTTTPAGSSQTTPDGASSGQLNFQQTVTTPVTRKARHGADIDLLLEQYEPDNKKGEQWQKYCVCYFEPGIWCGECTRLTRCQGKNGKCNAFLPPKVKICTKCGQTVQRSIDFLESGGDMNVVNIRPEEKEKAGPLERTRTSSGSTQAIAGAAPMQIPSTVAEIHASDKVAEVEPLVDFK